MSRRLPTGEAGRERGAVAERRVLNVLTGLGYAARLATTEEDHNGIDVVVTVGERALHLQVKCSTMGLEKFRALHPRSTAAVVIASDRHGNDRLTRTVLRALDEARARAA